MGGTADILIGAVLGSGSLIGLAYVVSQICARLLAEHRPRLSSEAEIYGEWVEVPAEGKWPAVRKGSGGREAASNDRHGEGK